LRLPPAEIPVFPGTLLGPAHPPIILAELAEIGLPVLTPLLDTYKDTDMHEPYPLYRLFARTVPGYADDADRSLDFVRLADGSALRGKVLLPDLQIDVNGTALPMPYFFT